MIKKSVRKPNVQSQLSIRSKIKITMLALGVIWSGTMITIDAIGVVKLERAQDFFITSFYGCAAGLGLQKKQDSLSEDGK
jgi:hypothetical protein